MTTTPGKPLAGLVLAALCATVPAAASATSPVLVIGPATVVDANHRSQT